MVAAAPLVAVPAGLPAPSLAAPTANAAVAGPAGVGAKSAFLYDDGAKKTKWSRAATTKRPIASITKVMTALVVLRAGKLDRTVTVKQKHIDYAVRQGGSMANLRAGDKLTVRQLLNGLLLPSGCDVAYLLADLYGPGWRGFVTKMNKTAAQLGMKSTKYANFDGLPWPSATSTYSTAYDQTRLAHFALMRADFRAIVARSSYKLAKNKTHNAYSWTNTNRLLGSYKGAAGIKTGTTDAAGYSLMFSARRGTRTLVGIVLNSSTTNETARFTDAARMLDWGFGAKSAGILRVPPVPAGANVD
ncbi:D-alanyl-D-alanine carboxypeptidase family protein [Actinomadura macra]|uniref:D-alanyl-D-alanine carboxypeptidase family protein n=1 Tax=Actinomadura macra TaxID=46164 RepID=UPI00082D6EEA|nr:serine hydrolase [Actinomadura macra]